MAIRREQIKYIDTIGRCCLKYPDLEYLCNFLRNSSPDRGRVVLLEFKNGKVNQRAPFNGAMELQEEFRKPKDPACKHRLYLMEDLSASYVEAFGSQFWMDPFLFASQERSNWVSGREPSLGMTYRLPSAQKKDSTFTLRYYEMRFSGNDINLPNDMKTDSNIDRIIDKEKFAEDGVFSVKRNASFWSRGNDEGWNAFSHVPIGLLLLEPPVGHCIRIAKVDSAECSKLELENKPYKGGFIDFSPWPNTRPDVSPEGEILIKNPPRTSMLDDIAFYWTKIAEQDEIDAAIIEPTEASRYLTKIVASSWNILLEYIWKTLNRMDIKLGNFEKPQSMDEDKVLDNLALALRNANLWRRRLSWYSEALELNLQSLGIAADFDISRVPRKPDSKDAKYLDNKEDFLAIYQRWRNAVKRLDSLIQVLIGTLSVLEGHLSISESKHVAILTWLGMVFIPLSFSASFFAMANEYQPGREKFWVYFAVALPMVAIVLVIAIFTRMFLRYRESRDGHTYHLRARLPKDQKSSVSWFRRRWHRSHESFPA